MPVQHFADFRYFWLLLPSAHKFTDHYALRIRKRMEVTTIIYVRHVAS